MLQPYLVIYKHLIIVIKSHIGHMLCTLTLIGKRGSFKNAYVMVLLVVADIREKTQMETIVI